MDIVYDPNFLEHYGVGHLDGGHSGRYPWGSGQKKQYVKQVRKINKTHRTFLPNVKEHNNAISEIQKLPGTAALANVPEIRNAYSAMRTASNEYAKLYKETEAEFKRDASFRKSEQVRLRELGYLEDEISEAFNGPNAFRFLLDEYLEARPDLEKSFMTKYETLKATRKKYSVAIIDQFKETPVGSVTFVAGRTTFHGMTDVEEALSKTLDEIEKRGKV